MIGQSTEQVRLVRIGVMACFFGSGLTSLVLETIWNRILGTVFGNTVLASSTVLTAFMLGLALGSIVIGKFVDRVGRPLLLYGLLELGVGLYALVFPWIMAVGSDLYIWFYRAYAPGYWTLNLTRLGLSLVFLLPPTFLMGGTLPVLGFHLGTGKHEPGREVGFLYGANTLGGVAGCVLAGFILLERLGVNGSLYTAGITALLVGMLGLALGRLAPDRTTLKAPAPPQPHHRRSAVKSVFLSSRSRRVVIAAFAVTGFCALACEVLYTRILLFLLSTTVYAFAIMLSTFLAGMALGAFISTRWLLPRLKHPLAAFGVLEVLVGLAILGSVYLLAGWGTIDPRWAQRLNFGGIGSVIGARYADAAVILLLPTMLMGMAFPVVSQCLLRGEPELGHRLGQAYGANTLGCVLGSLVAGFLLLPVLGTLTAFLLVADLNLAAGILLLWHATERGATFRWGLLLLCAAVPAIAFLCTPPNLFWGIINLSHAPAKLSFVREHSTGTVTVDDISNGDRVVAVDGIDVAGLNFMLRTTQKLQGYIPLALHPNPRRVLQIGFGSGETARVGMEFGVPEYTVVELCPAIFEAAPLFAEVNHGSYHDPRVRRIIMDGKNFALLSGEKFDLILNDSIFPGSCGSSALYTYDHFRNCRDRLAPGGLFSCWVPLDLRASETRMILKTFQQVFPHTSFWVASNCLNKHGLILGSLEPLQIDFSRLAQVLDQPAVKKDLAEVCLFDPYDFLDCFMCDEAAIRRLVAADPMNTDTQPRLEFSCARSLSIPWKVRLLQTLGMLTDFRSPVLPCVTNLPDPENNRAEMSRRFEASTHIFQGLVNQLANDPKSRRQEFDLARKCIPDHPHVKSCEAELKQEIHDLRQLLEQYPGSTITAEHLADKLYLALQYQEAATLYEYVLRARAAPAETSYLNLARIQFATGATAAAEQTLLDCVQRMPRSAEAHDLIAGIYLKGGRSADALRHLQQALELQPGDPRFQEHYAQATGRK